MKTITLTDEAYQRLRDRKMDSRESFSSVVIRLVPRRGTLSDLSAEIDKLPPLTDAQATLMSEAVAWANNWGNLDT